MPRVFLQCLARITTPLKRCPLLNRRMNSGVFFRVKLEAPVLPASGDQSLAALPSSGIQNLPAAPGGHPGPEPMLSHPGDPAGLIGSLHNPFLLDCRRLVAPGNRTSYSKGKRNLTIGNARCQVLFCPCQRKRNQHVLADPVVAVFLCVCCITAYLFSRGVDNHVDFF